MKYELVIVGALETNCYLVYCEKSQSCAIIDPGAEPEKIFAAVAELELKPTILLNTHGHIDHIGANLDMKNKYGVPLSIHSSDSPMLQATEGMEIRFLLGAKNSPPPDHFLADGESMDIGEIRLQVLHTPGHSPGSVSFVGDGILFSGDTLFRDGVGRTDLPGGSWKDLENSIKEKILTLPPETVILPGHGPGTTVEQEIRSNPFFS